MKSVLVRDLLSSNQRMCICVAWFNALTCLCSPYELIFCNLHSFVVRLCHHRFIISSTATSASEGILPCHSASFKCSSIYGTNRWSRPRLSRTYTSLVSHLNGFHFNCILLRVNRRILLSPLSWSCSQSDGHWNSEWSGALFDDTRLLTFRDRPFFSGKLIIHVDVLVLLVTMLIHLVLVVLRSWLWQTGHCLASRWLHSLKASDWDHVGCSWWSGRWCDWVLMSESLDLIMGLVS